jgi:hypothetical protein
MTLLELLRQELPKRGGWPEGVRYITQDNGFSTYKGTICGYDSLPKFNGKIWLSDELCQHAIKPMKMDVIASDHATAIVTREQYEAMGWDGTGLPPVGVECEYSLNSGRTWFKCKIDYILGTQGLVMLADVFEGGQWVSFREYDGKLKFRPLRTEAERAIDEMVRLSGVSIGAAKILYDAGYRK